MKAIFDSFDSDKNGYMDQKEMGEFVKTLLNIEQQMLKKFKQYQVFNKEIV